MFCCCCFLTHHKEAQLQNDREKQDKLERQKMTESVKEWKWAQYAAQGSGHRGQNGEGNAAQISSVADSSLTGIRGLSVNNRGSVLGQPAPLQSLHFSSTSPSPPAQQLGVFLQRGNSFTKWNTSGAPSASSQTETSRLSQRIEGKGKKAETVMTSLI